ncbi:MAG: right-handed parallel beta-helix repeat-containing protein, partial [candidate division Zixibacteria bacterium]|nr:right-handed parallel beta-helix repeat-containing protein [candidate division Zixibacteria bacterium]
ILNSIAMHKWALVAIVIMTFCLELTWTATLQVERGSDLQSVIDYAGDGDTLVIGVRDFPAKPTPFIDSLCGNCENPLTEVAASYGFIIKDKALVLVGQDRSMTRLVTNAGYGVYFKNSNGSQLINLTVTGGKRDPDGNATDAGIVIRKSRVYIENVNVENNDHRIDAVVVGIGGVFGREGAEITIRDCNIINNQWDGIALYRGAVATITDCLIKDGRGAGIGVTWDATCMAFRNEITGYWKGIGAFGSSWVIARNNLVHDNLGWGIIATGQSHMDITNNVVYHNGNCGIAPWSTESRGRIANNIVTDNGWRNKWVCPCVGIWNYGDWAKWQFSNNNVWNNKDGNYEAIWDPTGLNGNISEDPKFIGEGNFHLQDNSPGVNSGDTVIYNTDGSVSHMGIFGGPQAKKKK